MDVWRRRPDAQQLGKVWPPSQPAENFKPRACVRACCAAEEWPHKLPAQATERTVKSEKHARSHLLVSISKGTTAQVRKIRGVGGGNMRWLQFSWLLPRYPPTGPTVRCVAKETQTLETVAKTTGKIKCAKEACAWKRRNFSWSSSPFPSTLLPGECALKITWSFKWKKKRNPFAGEEFALKTDTSFSSM